MSTEKKYNVVEFVYTDNGQMFSSGAHLTDREVTLLGSILDRFEQVKAIEQQSVYVPIQTNHNFDGVLDEVLKALENEVTDGDDRSQCQNCDRVWPDSVMIPLEQVKKLLERVTPGEPMPSGECPACGALCYPFKEDDEHSSEWTGASH